MHQVELTIADSSTLLAAAVAAFQTGHTIEMTGAILNTLSSVTDENGLTIISGEEVPVHTTVQYKCTICQMIFYEKQYICQHLFDAHNFQIDVSYFEEIELQQQDQLQQKINEQQQEQLMLQQQQQQMEGLSDKVGEEQQQSEVQTEPQTLIPVANQNITDETAAVMMMMMNGSISTPQQAQQSGIILQANQVTDLNQIIAAGGQIITQQSFDGSVGGGGGGGTATPQTAIPILNVAPAKTHPPINYTCSYCSFGADKLKKMSDHLKQTHPLREKTCMDNIRQQVIRLPNEDLPPYNQNPPTVGTLLNMQAAAASQNSLAASLAQVDAQQTAAKQPYNGKKRGPKPKTSPKSASSGLKATKSQPTILTMDANSQIIIDFNQNDDLLCSLCDYTINNLNYMRTHIKYKHKNQAITFQNKASGRYYTIVEWPITAVPTLTPASSEQAQTEQGQGEQQAQKQQAWVNILR